MPRLGVAPAFGLVAALLPLLSARAEPTPQVGRGTNAGSWPLEFLPAAALEVEGQEIHSGVRIERDEAGLRVAGERFETGGEPNGLSLPPRLGGGYVFFQPTAASGLPSTAVYRAQTWTGAMRPLALLPFAVEEVQAGFDRLYFLSGGIRVALDAESGALLSLAPLPPLVTLQELSFLDDRSALVRGPIVGTLATTNAGLSWFPLARAEAEDAEEVNRPSAPTDAMDWPRSAAGAASGGALRPGRLSEIIVRGVPTSQTEIVALVEGRLLRLRRPGWQVSEQVVPGLEPEARCQGIEGTPDRGASFLCQGERTEVFRLVAKAGQMQVESVRRFAPARRVLALGGDGLLVEGGCAPAAVSAQRRGCWVSDEQSREIPLGPPATREVFASTPQGPLSIRGAAEGPVRVQRLGVSEPATAFSVPEERELASLIREGTWLRAATPTKEGLTFWVTLGDRFAGVLLDAERKALEVGAIQRPVRRALLAGSRGLVWGAAGFTRLTTDGGSTYQEVDFPYRSGDPDPNAVVSSAEEVVLGCGPVGCSLGRWLSLGWRLDQKPRVAPLPQRTPIPPPGGGRFRFDCVATGVRSPPSLESAEPTSGEDGAGFWERPLPPVLAGYDAFEIGDSRKLVRVAAWGPRDVPWGQQGKVQIAFRDVYSVGTLGTSTPAPGLFVDSVRAKDALGLLDPASQLVVGDVSAWGTGGVVLVRTRQGTSLLAFSQREAVRLFRPEEELQLRAMAGVVVRPGQWLLGNLVHRSFQIIDLSAQGASLFAEFPIGDTGHRDLSLVESTSGELGVAMAGDDGLFVYPISENGALGDPIVVPHAGSRPERCAPEARGYVVERELSIAPYVESRGKGLDIDRLRLRLIVGYGAACVEAAAGEIRGELSDVTVDPKARGLPLVVSDLGPAGRRHELVCD